MNAEKQRIADAKYEQNMLKRCATHSKPEESQDKDELLSMMDDEILQLMKEKYIGKKIRFKKNGEEHLIESVIVWQGRVGLYENAEIFVVATPSHLKLIADVIN